MLADKDGQRLKNLKIRIDLFVDTADVFFGLGLHLLIRRLADGIAQIDGQYTTDKQQANPYGDDKDNGQLQPPADHSFIHGTDHPHESVGPCIPAYRNAGPSMMIRAAGRSCNSRLQKKFLTRSVPRQEFPFRRS